MKRQRWRRLGGLLMLGLFSCSAQPEPMVMTVQASAYNSLPEQTNAQPSIAAWGDRLQPGMKVIAVSRDLLRAGLGYGVEVRIEGLKGRYRVLDKMHPRWERKIDIYMGEDLDAALEWGLREVRIHWNPVAD